MDELYSAIDLHSTNSYVPFRHRVSWSRIQ